MRCCRIVLNLSDSLTKGRSFSSKMATLCLKTELDMEDRGGD